MSAYPEKPLRVPSAWVGSALANHDWIRPLEKPQLYDLERATRHARATGKPLAALTRDDFPLPVLGPAVEGWLAELDRGRGFLLVRGIPVERYDEDELATLYYGLGLHLGTAVSQNAAGDLLGHVCDTGADPKDPSVRLYKTREPLGFHCDGSDIVGLLCVRPARSGGTSRIVSSVTVFNEVLCRRPDLVPLLFEPFAFDRNEEQRPGEPPFFQLPLCHWNPDGERLRTFYIGWYIRGAQRQAEAPRLTKPQRELLDLIDAIAEDPTFHLDMDFRPGDIQWLKNAVTLHARTAYEDDPEPARRRHLLRLWLTARTPFSDGDELLRGGIPRKDDAEPDRASVGARKEASP